jgi:hypothetical protein
MERRRSGNSPQPVNKDWERAKDATTRRGGFFRVAQQVTGKRENIESSPTQNFLKSDAIEEVARQTFGRGSSEFWSFNKKSPACTVVWEVWVAEGCCSRQPINTRRWNTAGRPAYGSIRTDARFSSGSPRSALPKLQSLPRSTRGPATSARPRRMLLAVF